MTINPTKMRALADAATAGPWRNEGEDSQQGYPFLQIARDVPCGPDAKYICMVQSTDDGDADFSVSDEDKANADFICASRTFVPAALDRIAELEGALAKIHDRLKLGDFDLGELADLKDVAKKALAQKEKA